MPMLRTMRILWAAQLAAAFVFLVVLLVMRSTGDLATEVEPFMLPSIGGVALIVAVTSFILPAKLWASMAQRTKPAIEEEVVEEEALFRQAPKTRRVFTKPQEARRTACGQWFTPFVLGMALGEAIAIFGLTLGLLGHGLLEVMPFFVVGWLLIALRLPRQRAIEAAFEKRHDAVFPADSGGD